MQKGLAVGDKQVLHEDGERRIVYEMLYDQLSKTSISKRRGSRIRFLTNLDVPVWR